MWRRCRAEGSDGVDGVDNVAHACLAVLAGVVGDGAYHRRGPADLDVEEIVTRSLMEAEQVVVEIRDGVAVVRVSVIAERAAGGGIDG